MTFLRLKLLCASLVLGSAGTSHADGWNSRDLAKTDSRQSCLEAARAVFEDVKPIWQDLDINSTSVAVYAYNAGGSWTTARSDMVIHCLIFDGKSHPFLVAHYSGDGTDAHKDMADYVMWDFEDKVAALQRR